MARCNDNTCSCVVRGGVGVAVHGAGTAQAPYVVTVDQTGRLSVLDTSTIDLTLQGSGTADDPGVLSAALIAHLGDLVDVAKGVPANGQVLAWTGSQWAPVPPTTAAVGSLTVGQGLGGDGSSGAALHAVADPNGGVAVGALGIALTQGTLDRLTALETRYPVNYLRVERDQALAITDNTWAQPASMNLGVTKTIGTRLSYAGGYITCLDAGVYQWEVTCVWAQLATQTSLSNQSCRIELNDVALKAGQRTQWVPADDVVPSHRESYTGTVNVGTNGKLRPGFYQNNPSNSALSVTPEQFTVYRVG